MLNTTIEEQEDIVRKLEQIVLEQRQKLLDLKHEEKLKNDAIKFPIKSVFYSHTDSEDNREDGIRLGFKDEQLEEYCRIGYEITFDIEVDADGISYATKVNGVALEERVTI